jgi:UDP-2-acetamido-3-amino-2,3-dideoxy-glucuronate N-acetyltransferase
MKRIETLTPPSLALIGAGNWGKNLARNFYTLGALHTICDVNEKTLDAHQADYSDVNLTTHIQSVINHPAIHQIVIATPAPLHYPLAKQALLAGKDIYVEKPLCFSRVEGEELQDLADEKGLILMVGHILQYHPAIISLQHLLKSEKLGQLQYIASNRLNRQTSIQREEDVLWDLAPHDVSIILSLFNDQMPQRVHCFGAACLSKEVADVALLNLHFDEEDKQAHIYVSRLNPFKEHKLVVVCSSAAVVFDDTKAWNEKLAIHWNPIRWSLDRHIQGDRSELEYIKVPQVEPLQEECKHFLDCCHERVTPRTDGTEAIRVIQVLEAAHESLYREKQTAHLSLKDLKNEALV